MKLIKTKKLKLKPILDQKKLYTRSAQLRFIQNLEGISQLSTEKSLYLCGSNKPSLHSSQTTGSYLFRYDLENNFKQPSVLVNSAYVHYNPMMVLVNNDILVVIGGKNQIFDLALYPESRLSLMSQVDIIRSAENQLLDQV